jgi:DNA-binding MarR family transcriptional regulator
MIPSLLTETKLANGNKDRGQVRPRTMYLLTQASKGLKKRLEQALSELAVTTMQYTVLSIVRDRQPLSSSELSRRFFVTPQTMNEVVAGLEKMGLLSRTEDPANRRILSVRLTEAGQKLVAKCEAAADRLEAEAFGIMSKTELNSLRKSLRAVLDDVRNSTQQDAGVVDAPVDTLPARRKRNSR